MEAQVFKGFKERDFVVVRLDDLGKLEHLRPVDVAQAIVDASQQGRQAVNFRLGSSHEYWARWTHYGNGAVIDTALEHLGYLVTFQTNPSSDGMYYHLQRKE